MKVQMYDGSEIELTEIQVLSVVQHWYITMTPDIFQSEDGADLEEYVGTQQVKCHEKGS